MDVDTLVEAWKKQKGIPAPFFGGKEVTLYFQDEEQLREFAPAILRFFTLTTFDRDSASHHAYAYFRDVVDEIGFEDGWVDKGLEAITEPDPKIWNYVYPSSISACLADDIGDPDSESTYVELEAGCGWEEEHGLQMCWRDGCQLVKLSAYNGHATNGHAYADKTKDAYVYYSNNRRLRTASPYYRH